MRIHRKLILIALILLIVLPPIVRAEENPGIHMSYIEDGHRLKLTVTARQAKDLYAYDLKLSFDPLLWKVIRSVSDMPGFSVEPIIDGGHLRFAHTQIGSVPGKQGNIALASFTFERITAGDANFILNEAKLVNSKIASTVYAPKLEVIAKNLPDPSFGLTDIQGHWAEQSINDAVLLGIVTGYPDGSFQPQQQVTRVEFAAMLIRALNLPTTAVKEMTFTDIEDIPTWAKGFAAAASETGLLTGYEDHTFRANRNISRIEMAAMIVRSLDKENTKKAAAISFQDNDQILDWGQPIAKTVVSTGLMQGRTGNLFSPNAYSSRAEAVTVIMRLLRLKLNYED